MHKIVFLCPELMLNCHTNQTLIPWNKSCIICLMSVGQFHVKSSGWCHYMFENNENLFLKKKSKNKRNPIYRLIRNVKFKTMRKLDF